MRNKIALSFMSYMIVPVDKDVAVSNSPVSYLIGGIIALLIMGYLIYTLLRPEKF